MVKRPISPHLSVYKPHAHITSFTSIAGRACGIYTYLFVIVVLWFVITSIYRYNNPTMPVYMLIMLLKASSPLITVVAYIGTFVTVFCVTFFTGTMIRHILWDHDIALDLRSSVILGYVIIALAVIVPIYTVISIAMM